jgi:poly-gamma-glutamate capsule biosynthesis protein CapA/YwtB (metallophosphatase superfamily)
MEDANLAFEQNPEKTWGVALVHQELARVDMDVCDSLYAMQLIVL